MPLEVKYIDNGLGIDLAGTGDLNGLDLVSAIKDIYQSDNLTKSKYGLFDYSCVADDNISFADVKAIAGTSINISKIVPNGIVAVVAKNNKAYGLSRMWEILTEKTNWETKIFRSRSDAEGWLIVKVAEKFNININLT